MKIGNISFIQVQSINNTNKIIFGPYQNESGSDGVDDTPYVIGQNNQDNYPLQNISLSYYTLLEKYDNLLTAYQNLDTINHKILEDLNNIRNLMHVFVGTTIILLASTIIFTTATIYHAKKQKHQTNPRNSKRL